MKSCTRGHKMQKVGNVYVYNQKAAKCETALPVWACERETGSTVPGEHSEPFLKIGLDRPLA